jgi:hypothetical protein
VKDRQANASAFPGVAGRQQHQPERPGAGTRSSGAIVLASLLLVRLGMKTLRTFAAATPSKKITMMLGDLVSAAYEASEGFGPQRAESAARLLTEYSRARRCSHQLRFVR